jgi:hypothetical protein
MHKRGLFSMHNISIGVREVVCNVTVLVLPLHLVRYRTDFGVTIADQIARVSSFLHKDSRLREDLLRLVTESNGNEISFELKYSNYDWSSNQVD